MGLDLATVGTGRSREDGRGPEWACKVRMEVRGLGALKFGPQIPPGVESEWSPQGSGGARFDARKSRVMTNAFNITP